MKNNKLLTTFLLSIASFSLFSCSIKRPSFNDQVEPENEAPETEISLEYFNSKKLSLSGTWNGSSDANNFLRALHGVKNAWRDNNQTAIDEFTGKYGEKFFFAFVSSKCETCGSFSEGFEYLENNANNFNFAGAFKLHTIVVDEKLDDSEMNHYKESPYKTLFNSQISTFEDIVFAGKQSYYAKNLVSTTDYINKLDGILTLDDVIDVPLICLIDLSKTNTEIVNGKEVRGKNFITQVFYSISGDDKIAKADYLSNCWMYKGATFGKEL